MKIGVISDTHIPERTLDIPEELRVALKDVGMIIHAGDLVTLDVLESLKKIGPPVKAVFGNMDNGEVRRVLKNKEIITIGKFKIGVIHGRGAPKNVPTLAQEAFNEKLDVIIFGHTHQAMCERHKDVLLMNPGSPTDTIFAPYRSYGILEINDTIEGKIVRLP
ncbi:metallophosphoesterase family protein [Thermoproteota archaeon]